MLDPKDAVLRVALGHTWVREIGPNRGQAVEAILARVGLPPGSPWCAAFVSYIGWLVLRKDWPLQLVGGCVSLADDAKAKGMLIEAPEPGAIFLLWGLDVKRFRHTGFVIEGNSVGFWRTVEGNTSPDGSPEGTGVFARLRKFGPSDRFIRWAKL